jgi:hypothetical protein
LSWSVTSSEGQPFLQNHWSKKMTANSSTVMLVLHGASWMSAPSLSVIVTMQSKLSSFGNGLMKSIATESKRLFGTGSGCSGPVGLQVRFLFHWHSVQEGIYASTRSRHMFGQ